MVRYIKEDIDFKKDFAEFDFGENDAEWYNEVKMPKECIKGATLLSEEEYKEYKENIPKKKGTWWLRSSRDVNFIRHFISDCHVGYIGNGIRPTLILDLQSSSFEARVGDKFKFGKHLFTIISNDLAICDDFIKKGCFRKDYEAEDANDYEKSDVKKVVDDWFNKAYSKYKF